MKRLRGFSLIEVLLALAVGGIVLMAASSLLVTISKLGQIDRQPVMYLMRM